MSFRWLALLLVFAACGKSPTGASGSARGIFGPGGPVSEVPNLSPADPLSVVVNETFQRELGQLVPRPAIVNNSLTTARRPEESRGL